MTKILVSVLVFVAAAFGCSRDTFSDGRSVSDSVRADVTAAVTEKAPETEAAPVTTEFHVPDSFTIDVKVVFQEPELPTGCEITSLTMILNHLGFDVSKTDMASIYLKKDYNGKVGFDQAFIGDPIWYGGYGCFAPVIKEAANKYLGLNAEGYLASDITGTSLDDLYEYVARGIPVAAWCSMDLIDVNRRFAFCDANQNEVYWYDNEHCVVLCGYDRQAGTITAADPLNGTVIWSAARFEEIYNELGKQAVIVEKIK
ncbi:MAG: C39 family peptidase [Oscillospiraceae bacterium]|nr:C39 family peptidase [Oscillospiraceae bacterium]